MARTLPCCGGGASIATDRRTTAVKPARSATGRRSGRTRSVKVDTPASIPGTSSRSATAAATARSSRVAARGDAAAAIEREVSRTNIAWTPRCTRTLALRVSAGCMAASPSSATPAAASAGSTISEPRSGAGSRSARRTAAARRPPSSVAASGTTSTSAARPASGVRNVISSRCPVGLSRRRGDRCGRSRRPGRAARVSRAPPSAAAAARGRTRRRRSAGRCARHR